jgi:hypothetical protein
MTSTSQPSPRTTPRTTIVQVVLFVAWTALAPTASAQSEASGVRFDFSRDAEVEGCPSGEVIRSAVRERLGRDPFAGDPIRIIEGHVRDDGGLVAEIVVRTSDGELVGRRELRSDEPTCDSLADAIVLAVALTIDPNALLSPRPPEPVEPPREPDPPPRAEAPPPPPIEDRTPTGGLALAVAVGAGLLPSVSVGPTLIASIDVVPWMSIEAGFTLWPEQSEADAGFGLTTGRLALCFAPLASDLRVLLCAVGQAGALHQVVRIPEPVDPGQRFWAAVGAAATFELRIAGPLTARAGVELVVPLVRDRFVTEAGAEIFEPPAVATAAHAGLGVRFD